MLYQQFLRQGGVRSRVLGVMLFTSFGLMALPIAAHAQSIVPANDGTGTIVLPNGNRYEITGGSFSRDGKNLFHSLQQFGLSQGEIATFLANPQVQNILGRVVGGSPSVIDGQIQVSGATANLYLLNPAGIVFGANASLNVPAAFTATTADRIGFGNNAWFRAIGSNDYAALLGNPTSFAFSTPQPGSIVNAGNLRVGDGQPLMLLGGTVVNTGTLTAPGGQITIAAVPGTRLVRVNPAGSLLSYEFIPADPTTGAAPSLPQLLTGEGIPIATGITVTSSGAIRLTGSTATIPTPTGTTIAAGQIRAASPTGTGGQVQVLGQQVALVGAQIDATGQRGGTVQIGGDYKGQGTLPTAQFTFGDRATSINVSGSAGSGGRVIVWSEDATRFYGTILARGTNGGSGGFVETSGKRFLDVSGARVEAAAPGGRAGTWLLDPFNVTINNTAEPFNVDQTGTDPTVFTPNGDNARISANQIANTLTAGTSVIVTTGTTGTQAGNITVAAPIQSVEPGTGIATLTLEAANDIQIDSPIQSFSSGPAWNVILNAGGNIRIGALVDTNGGDFRASGVSFATIAPISTASFNGLRQGDIVIRATRGSIATTDLTTADLTTRGPRAGNVTLLADQGGIRAGNIRANANFGVGGTVRLEAVGGDVEVATIDASSGSFAGGDILVNQNSLQPGFFRATGVLGNVSVPTSLLTTRGGDRGTIQIRHAGGTQTPFVVGNASTNGTAGAISTGAEAIAAGTAIVGNFTSAQGSIRITTIVPTPTPSPSPRFTEEQQEDLADDLDEPDDDEEIGSIPTDGSENDTADSEVTDREDMANAEIEEYLDLPDTLATDNPIASLNEIKARTNIDPAVVYLGFAPAAVANRSSAVSQGKSLAETPAKAEAPQPEWQFTGDQLVPTDAAKPLSRKGRLAQSRQRLTDKDDLLELVVVSRQGKPIRRVIAGATRAEVQRTIREFINEVTDPRKVRTTSYLSSAQKLYQWMVAPIEPVLKEQGIDNLAYVSETGLRFIPLAALHDGKQFLVEKYSVGLMPSLSLTDTRYTSLKDARVLAMGASRFQSLPPLPAVPTELSLISQTLWKGESALNEAFTLQNLKARRQQTPYQIIHLATHGEFRSGGPSNSYIQLWDTRLRLDQLRQLGWNNPPVELLVLSACRTAIGNDDAELGFAGLALQAGVKTAMASLWYVSDEGTLGLMGEFYRQLQTAPIKAEALRQAQIAMLRGEVTIDGQQLRTSRGGYVLPPNIIRSGKQTLSHPYYWAAFTLIGSPW